VSWLVRAYTLSRIANSFEQTARQGVVS